MARLASGEHSYQLVRGDSECEVVTVDALVLTLIVLCFDAAVKPARPSDGFAFLDLDVQIVSNQ